MDAPLTAAARALAAGDSLAALRRVALREDPPAIALRGIAMAQLGEYGRARALLRRAARRFGAKHKLAQARCLVAEAEVALAMRDFSGTPRALLGAAATLLAHGDLANAQHAHLLGARRLLLLGRLDEATRLLATFDGRAMRPALVAVAALLSAELALRALRTAAARVALDHAEAAARRAAVPALTAEVAELRASLSRPAARCLTGGVARAVRLDEVAALRAGPALVVDACRRSLHATDSSVSLARRPLLFALARALAQAWPAAVSRADLIACAFNTRRPDDSHRARLRVELGRLRALIAVLAAIEATPDGFRLAPVAAREVVVLAPPVDGEQAALVALLADGAAWSTSALALALGDSQRTVQRALVELESEGRVRSVGRARTQRWLAPPLTEFTTILLLPAAPPYD